MPRLITTFTKNTLKVFANVFSSVTRLFSSAEDILFILLIFWESIIWQFFWNFLLEAQLFNRWLKNKKGAGRWRGQPVLHHFYEFYFFSCFIYLFVCFFYGMLATFTSSKLCPQNICVNLIFWWMLLCHLWNCWPLPETWLSSPQKHRRCICKAM